MENTVSSNFDPHLSIFKRIFDCHLSSVNRVHRELKTCKVSHVYLTMCGNYWTMNRNYMFRLYLFKKYKLLINKYYLGFDTRKPEFIACKQQRCRPACASKYSDRHLCYSLSANNVSSPCKNSIFKLVSVADEQVVLNLI